MAEYLTLEEYTLMAKKCLSRYAPKIKQTDEAIATVVYWCAKADETYNPEIGTREGFRASYGRFGVLKWINELKKKCKLKSSVEDIDNSIISRSTNDNPVYNAICSDIYSLIENAAYLSDRQKEIYLDYYKNGSTLEEIAQKQDCTRQNVSLIINKVTDKLKEKLHVTN